MLDPLDTLALVATATEAIRLGTSVLNLPLHIPAHLAKRIASLDVLANGRAFVGAGSGWSEDEYVASNVPFAKRGQMNEQTKLNCVFAHPFIRNESGDA